MKNPSRKMAKTNHLALALTMKELLQGPVTTHEIADLTGLHLQTVYELFRVLKKNDVVHVSAWEPDKLGRDSMPVFTLGAGRDKKRRCKSRAEIARDYRLRKLAKATLGSIVSEPACAP